jgi:hypothetical protein
MLALLPFCINIRISLWYLENNLAMHWWLMHVNPSYPGGRDQEDHHSKSARANSSQDPILKKPSQKWAGGVAQIVSLEFKL